MAIKIPSRNIYEINNPKIRDNLIDNVSVEQSVVEPNNEYDTSVYNEKIYKLELVSAETENENLDKATYDSGGSGATAVFVHSVSYVAYNKQEVSNFEIKIPLLQNNTYIHRLYNGKNKNEENDIKYTIYGDIKKGYCSGVWDFYSKGSITYGEATSVETNVVFSIPKELEQAENSYSSAVSTKAQVKINDLSQLNNDYSVIVENDKEYYKLNISALCGLRTVKMSGAVSWVGASGQQKPTDIVVSGEYIEYNPKNIEITIYGDTIGIDLSNGTISYGSGNKPHSLSGNELLQNTAFSSVPFTFYIDSIDKTSEGLWYYLITKVSTKLSVGDIVIVNSKEYTVEKDPATSNRYRIFYGDFSFGFIGDTISALKKDDLSKILAENVLSQYANGKETATLRCDINNYYDYTSNDKKIDITTSNMTFKEHDEVVPMVFGANNIDYPMSKNKNGTAKVFEVISVNMIYDGAVWQELTLLEKNT